MDTHTHTYLLTCVRTHIQVNQARDQYDRDSRRSVWCVWNSLGATLVWKADILQRFPRLQQGQLHVSILPPPLPITVCMRACMGFLCVVYYACMFILRLVLTNTRSHSGLNPSTGEPRFWMFRKINYDWIGQAMLAMFLLVCIHVWAFTCM